jgi:hypothetical protein
MAPVILASRYIFLMLGASALGAATYIICHAAGMKADDAQDAGMMIGLGIGLLTLFVGMMSLDRASPEDREPSS